MKRRQRRAFCIERKSGDRPRERPLRRSLEKTRNNERGACAVPALRPICLQLHADPFRPTKPPATLMREEIQR
jgi:hypothetical protein